jgi:periplasmic protein TonB
MAPSVTIASAARMPVIAVPTNTAVPKLTAPPVRVLTGGAIKQQVQPAYPTNARTMRIEGPVALQAHVTPEGNVDKVKVVSGNPLLASAAVDAVKKWKFDPQKLNGQAVDFEKAITLNFNLPH